jgi:hypothetical protein
VAEVARRKLAELLPPSRVRCVTFSKDPHLGPYILVEVAMGASEALELWEKLVEELHPRLKTPIFVAWSGGVDVSPAELGRRLGKLLAKMRVSPLTLSRPVDVVEELEREWWQPATSTRACAWPAGSRCREMLQGSPRFASPRRP